MASVGAPKKELTSRTITRLETAAAARSAADDALWQACAAAVLEGTYEDVAAIVGVSKSTLQEKVRAIRKSGS